MKVNLERTISRSANIGRTIQDALERRLKRFFSKSVTIAASGRTDAGVHGSLTHFIYIYSATFYITFYHWLVAQKMLRVPSLFYMII